MDGKTRWRGWLVPWLLGTALQGGCQLLQPTTTAEPPLANGKEDRLVAVAQTPADLPGKPAAGPTPPSAVLQSSDALATPRSIQDRMVATPQGAPQTTIDPSTNKPPPVAAPAGDAMGFGAMASTGVVVSQTAYPPAPPPLLPPPANVSPMPTLAPAAQAAAQAVTITDARPEGDHQLARPSGTGSILNMQPGDHPIERLAEVTLRLQAKEEEARKLEARLQQMTALVEQRGQSVSAATHDVQEATEEIRQTRKALQTTRQEVDEAWANLRRREKEDIDTIKEILKKLDRPSDNMPSPGNDDHAPARP
jgi:hypothetical protein